ncbi:MAG: hypothetical protein M1813_001308 [Trichoglossum hirsutum]|nr:MAG: hypothetical protein M1813_001308 [Trichoglossum hirsutum]
MKELQAFIVADAQEQTNDEKDSGYWGFTCLTYDFNGTSFNRVIAEFRIDEFKGTKVINSLLVYPLKYHIDTDGKKDVGQVKKQLIERGKLFKNFCIKLRGEQMLEYAGNALVMGQGIRLSKSNTSVSFLMFEVRRHPPWQVWGS